MSAQWIFTLSPVLVLLVLSVVKSLLRKFRAAECALELHITGTTYFAPLPIMRIDLAGPLTLAVFVSCLFLCVSLACYIIVEFKLRRNRRFYKVIGMLTGGSILIAGFVASIMLS